MQTYHSGEPVRIGDLVSWPTDQGKVVALQEDLPSWGLDAKEAEGKILIEFVKTGLVCESSATAEDVTLISRAPV